jgi:hypothetical protein
MFIRTCGNQGSMQSNLRKWKELMSLRFQPKIIAIPAQATEFAEYKNTEIRQNKSLQSNELFISRKHQNTRTPTHHSSQLSPEKHSKIFFFSFIQPVHLTRISILTDKEKRTAKVAN